MVILGFLCVKRRICGLLFCFYFSNFLVCYFNLGYGIEDDILYYVFYLGRIFYVYILFYNL